MSYARIEGLLRSHAAKKITLAEVSELIHLLAAERTEEARVYSITRDEDAARMRELDALVAEPLTVERLESVYMAVTASPSLDKPPVGVLRLRGLTAVALAIFAAQRTERAVEAANAEWQREYPEDEHAGMLRTIAANQRAAVDGFGESDKNPGRRALRCVRALAERDAERAVNEADARRWREAVEGVGDVERYARILWDAEQIDHSYDSWDACATEYIHLARAIIAAFRALALSDGAIEAASRGGDTWVDARCIRAALDYACSDVGAG